MYAATVRRRLTHSLPCTLPLSLRSSTGASQHEIIEAIRIGTNQITVTIMRESESAVARRESIRRARSLPAKSLAASRAARVAHEPVFQELDALLKVAQQRQSGGIFVLNVEVRRGVMYFSLSTHKKDICVALILTLRVEASVTMPGCSKREACHEHDWTIH